MLFVAAKIDFLDQNHVQAQDPILRTLQQHWLYSCKKRDTSSLVFIWFLQIWILKFIVGPIRFEFIMQPSKQIRKFFRVHKLWVKSLLTYRSEALWRLVSESCCGRQRECSRQRETGFPFPLHTYKYQCNKAGNMLLLFYLAINISRPMVALSSFNIFLCLCSLFNSI